MGIQRDVGLVGQQYALLGTILYVGILVGEVSSAHIGADSQIPANRIIQLFPIAKFLGCLVILWVRRRVARKADRSGHLGDVSCCVQDLVRPHGCAFLVRIV